LGAYRNNYCKLSSIFDRDLKTAPHLTSKKGNTEIKQVEKVDTQSSVADKNGPYPIKKYTFH
jgi:hypothetical protein